MTEFPHIALTGKFRSGKDTVADYLIEKYGYAKFAFGDELKRYVHELFDVNPSTKPRELYQWFGQTMRKHDPDIWVRKCFEKIDKKKKTANVSVRVVISDLRQPNEYERCRAEGYVIIRVNCPEDIRIERARAAGDDFTEDDLNHETEQYVDLYAVDYDIYNVGDLTELYSQIDAIMLDLAKKNRLA